MQRTKNVIMRKDIYLDNMDIVLLPDDIFTIEGYLPVNIDDTNLIDEYIQNSMSELDEGDSINLYINYGFTRALVSTLNLIFQKKLDCTIQIYNEKIYEYVNFGKLQPRSRAHTLDTSAEPVSFQLINRPFKKQLEETIHPVFSGEKIDEACLFDSEYFTKTAYDSMKPYAGRKVYIYVTGLKQALIACVNASRELDIQIVFKHYNPDDESYEHEQKLYFD